MIYFGWAETLTDQAKNVTFSEALPLLEEAGESYFKAFQISTNLSAMDGPDVPLQELFKKFKYSSKHFDFKELAAIVAIYQQCAGFHTFDASWCPHLMTGTKLYYYWFAPVAIADVIVDKLLSKITQEFASIQNIRYVNEFPEIFSHCRMSQIEHSVPFLKETTLSFL